MVQKALFLDRDGVINVDHGHVCSPEKFNLVDGILDVMRWFQDRNYILIVVTNQAGIAKGYYTEEQFLIFDAWVRERIAMNGVHITKTFYCPYHPEGAIDQYTMFSDHRKPEPGMFFDAIAEFGIDPYQSVMIGDKGTDMTPAKLAGIPLRFLIGNDPESNDHTAVFADLHQLLQSLGNVPGFCQT